MFYKESLPNTNHEYICASGNTTHYSIHACEGAVAKSSANGMVGTGFASRYWLQPRVGL